MRSTESWKNWQYLTTRYRDIRDGKEYEIFAEGECSKWLGSAHWWQEISHEDGERIGEKHGPFIESGEAETDLWSR